MYFQRMLYRSIVSSISYFVFCIYCSTIFCFCQISHYPVYDQITHSTDGCSELFSSSITALVVTVFSFFEPVTEGCGTSVILELRICQQSISSCLLRDNGNNPMCGCVCISPTLSSALNRISLSGKAPSKDIHWSRTSCGSDSSSFTGSTTDPIGWSHALDNYM